MKSILFAIILIAIAASSFAQSYTYKKVVRIEKGSDCFSFDKKTILQESGNIIINEKSVSINDKVITIKKQVDENTFNAKGCTLQYVYCDGKLSALRVIKAAMQYFYVIGNTEEKALAVK